MFVQPGTGRSPIDWTLQELNVCTVRWQICVWRIFWHVGVCKARQAGRHPDDWWTNMIYVLQLTYLNHWVNLPFKVMNSKYRVNLTQPTALLNFFSTVSTFNSCTKCVGSQNILQTARPITTKFCGHGFMISQMNVRSLICVAYLLACYPWVFAQPGTGRHPVDWWNNWLSIL